MSPILIRTLQTPFTIPIPSIRRFHVIVASIAVASLLVLLLLLFSFTQLQSIKLLEDSLNIASLDAAIAAEKRQLLGVDLRLSAL